MEIRAAAAKDWKELRSLYLSLLKSDPGAFAETYQAVEAQSEREWIERIEAKNGRIFVAVEQGAFVGSGRVGYYEGLPGIAVLHKLGVLPEYRRKGIARALVAAREAWAQDTGASRIRLYVMAGRQKTLAFFLRRGYFLIPGSDASGNTEILEKRLAAKAL